MALRTTVVCSHYSPNVPTLPRRLVHHLQSRAQSPTRSPSSLACNTSLLSSAGPTLPFLKAPPLPHGFQVHLLPFSPTTPALAHLLLGAFAAGRWHWTMLPLWACSFTFVENRPCAEHCVRAGPQKNIHSGPFLKFCLRVSTAWLDLKLLEGRSHEPAIGEIQGVSRNHRGNNFLKFKMLVPQLAGQCLLPPRWPAPYSQNA